MSCLGNRISVYRNFVFAFALLTVCVFDTTVVTAQDAGGPPWGEWLKSPLRADCFKTWRRRRDPLLNEPFIKEGEDTPKGLASKLRAREVDIPNRIRAIHYLAKRDCTVFPEAKEMLILAMQEDKWEEVRYAAATGLCEMLTRHSCNPCSQNGQNGGRGGSCQSCQSCNNGRSQRGSSTCSKCDNGQGGSRGLADRVKEGCRNLSLKQYWCDAAFDIKDGQKGPRESGPDLMELPCHCRSCCDADTLKALAKTAYELDEKGCPSEPSKRVREKAVEAIAACGIPCHYSPYYAVPEEEAPPASEEGERTDDGGGEKTAPVPDESGDPSATLLPVTQASLRSIDVAPSPIGRLNGLCIVSLKNGRQVQGSDQFQSIYKGRIYTFANADCRNLFDANPESYAVAFGGCDPVHFVKTHQAMEGRYLVSHADRLYMFSTKENVSLFRENPERYMPQTGSQVASAK
ncbi:MAG: hypothetical protein R3C19_19775 [Planctomycetaceae bacterium]